MTIDEIQNIVDYAYPNIKKYYGKAKKAIQLQNYIKIFMLD